MACTTTTAAARVTCLVAVNPYDEAHRDHAAGSDPGLGLENDSAVLLCTPPIVAAWQSGWSMKLGGSIVVCETWETFPWRTGTPCLWQIVAVPRGSITAT